MAYTLPKQEAMDDTTQHAWVSFKWEDNGALTPLATPGPYQSDSLNRKLQEAKEWLAGRGKQA